jgi:hypothetical protein
MQECPQCRKLFDPIPMSSDFCPDCADAIRDEFGLPALLRGARLRWLNRFRRLLSFISQRNERQLENAPLAKESRTRIMLSFAAHQIIGTWGVGVTVPWLVAFGFDLLRLFGRPFLMRDSYWISTETGFFPFQIAFALFLGWLLGRDLRRRSMIWVWVLPFAILCYAVAAIPTVSPFPISPNLQSSIGQSRLWHYFGWGCRAEHRCLDQVVILMPFYAAAAYSIGALVAPRRPADTRPANTVRFWSSLIVGLIFLAGATSIVIEAMQPQAQLLLRQSVPESLGELRWLMLSYALVPVVAGAGLILFADWMRRKQNTNTVTDIG